MHLAFLTQIKKFCFQNEKLHFHLPIISAHFVHTSRFWAIERGSEVLKEVGILNTYLVFILDDWVTILLYYSGIRIH